MLFKTSAEDQIVFRVILRAMSRPGKVFVLPEAPAKREKWGSLLELLIAVMDNEVTNYVVNGALYEDFVNLLYTATKSPFASIKAADFIIVPGGDTKGAIAAAKRGTLDYPDAAATVVYQVFSVAVDRAKDGGPFLEGPGIHGRISLPWMDGFNGYDLRLLSEINGDFPLGVDTLFVDEEGRIIAIPRSTRIID
jgi:alpha-D-ribose 1-methylphosphonate 5-triphosphate synthase subunit PhnH